MQSMDCGGAFVAMELYWPVTPEVTEPKWHITTDVGNEIVIGALSGEAECIAAEETVEETVEETTL